MTLRDQALALRAQGLSIKAVRRELRISQERATELCKDIPRGAVRKAPATVQGVLVEGVLVLPYVEPAKRVTAQPVGRRSVMVAAAYGYIRYGDAGCYWL